MNRKKVSIAVVSMAVAFLAVTCVTASPRTSNTPLYTYRMEQASSGMSFLPTPVNEFSYNTGDGCTLNWGFTMDDGAPRRVFILLDTWKYEYIPYGMQDQLLDSCGFGTCYGKTCKGTCPSDTCGRTCPFFDTAWDAWLCNTALDALWCGACDLT